MLQIIHKKHYANLLTIDITVDILNSTQLAVVCDALKHCTNLKKLKLSLRGISVEDCQCVADSLTGLQELNLHCSNFSEAIMLLLLDHQNISGLQRLPPKRQK